MTIYVIFATHNGEATLNTTLAAFTQLNPPRSGLRYIAVDNNSRDRSREILESYTGKLPLLVIAEEKAGKVPAIERGIKEVDPKDDDLIVFTDDDVIPDPDWLKSYERAATENPNVDVFAGQVRHHWEQEPPDWLVRLAEDGLAFAGTPIGREAGEFHWSGVKGLNFSVRPEVLRHCRFRSDLWVAGSVVHGGEETDFSRQAVEQGHVIYFVPEAKVSHIVRPHQMKVSAILSRYYGIGHSTALTDPNLTSKYSKWQLKYNLVRHTFFGTAKIIIWLSINNRYRAMRTAVSTAKMLGYTRRSLLIVNNKTQLSTS